MLQTDTIAALNALLHPVSVYAVSFNSSAIKKLRFYGGKSAHMEL